VCGGPSPPHGCRSRLGRDLQQQIAEPARPGATLGQTALALGLGPGGGPAVDVVGQRNQPDEQEILAAGVGSGRNRHDITPCRRSVGAVGSTGKHEEVDLERSLRIAHPPRCRPPRPSGSLRPRLVSGLRSVLSRTGVAPSRDESPGGSVPRPFSDTVAGAASVLHRLPNSPRLLKAGHLERHHFSAAIRDGACKSDIDWCARTQAMATGRALSSKTNP